MRVDPSDCSDAELIRAAGADAAAFGLLYERHALGVYTWSRRRPKVNIATNRAARPVTVRDTHVLGQRSRHTFLDRPAGSVNPKRGYGL